MELYLNSSSDFSITDENGKEYTTEEAQIEYEHINDLGKFNCNLAFMRLINNGFNLESVKEHYINNQRTS